MRKILYPLVFSMLLSGCFASRFPISPTNLAIDPTYSDTKIFLLWGLVPQPKYTDPAQVCGSIENVSMVETKTSFWDGVISCLTLGLISTQTANVYCSNYAHQSQYLGQYQYQPVVPVSTVQGYPQSQWQTQSPYPPYANSTYPRGY